VPAPSYTDSRKKLVEDMRATAGSGSRQFDIAKAILDVKGQEEIAEQTESLRNATWVLALATIGLVIATIVLALISIN